MAKVYCLPDSCMFNLSKVAHTIVKQVMNYLYKNRIETVFNELCFNQNCFAFLCIRKIQLQKQQDPQIANKIVIIVSD